MLIERHEANMINQDTHNNKCKHEDTSSKIGPLYSQFSRYELKVEQERYVNEVARRLKIRRGAAVRT